MRSPKSIEKITINENRKGHNKIPKKLEIRQNEVLVKLEINNNFIGKIQNLTDQRHIPMVYLDLSYNKIKKIEGLE